MKRTNYLINGVAAVAVMFLFAQCAGKTEDKTGGAASGGAVATTNMKIAYVEIDTLLTQYNFWNDLNEAMMKKPTVTTQHIAKGHDDNSKCKDSAVAQQLTAANAINATVQTNFK